MVTGARTCKVVLSYAPNLDEPLDVIYDMEGCGRRLPTEWFAHRLVVVRYRQAPNLDVALPHKLPSASPPSFLSAAEGEGYSG